MHKLCLTVNTIRTKCRDNQEGKEKKRKRESEKSELSMQCWPIKSREKRSYTNCMLHCYTYTSKMLVLFDFIGKM